MNKNIEKKIKDIEQSLSKEYEKISEISLYNQHKVLKAFQKNKVALTDFAGSTGYGYDDVGKTKLSKIFAEIMKAESAIASPLLTCGTHTLSTALFGLLRPGDLFVSIGECYDTLKEIISGKNGSLKEWGITYKLLKYDTPTQKQQAYKFIENKKPKLVFIQRSRGYTRRTDGYSIDELKLMIDKVKKASNNSIVMVDNCYDKYTKKKEPIEVGADVVAGSLIKNPGGGIAPTGGYIAGRKNLIAQISGRFTAPSLGTEVGSYNASYQNFFEGLFLAPHITSRVIKGSMLLGKTLSHCKINSAPSPSQIPHDIVRSIEFNDKEAMIKFVQMVQQISPVDSHVRPEPWAMPGYKDEIIMAAGTFVQGSSIELSCDGPVKPPYIAYIQGGITYEHIQILCENIIKKFGK